MKEDITLTLVKELKEKLEENMNDNNMVFNKSHVIYMLDKIIEKSNELKKLYESGESWWPN